jgi:hypothetical protein
MFVDPHQQFGTPKFMRNTSNSNDTNGGMNLSNNGRKMESSTLDNKLTVTKNFDANLLQSKMLENKVSPLNISELMSEIGSRHELMEMNEDMNKEIEISINHPENRDFTNDVHDIHEINQINQIHEILPNKHLAHRMSSLDSHRSTPESIENSECAPPTSQLQAELKFKK